MKIYNTLTKKAEMLSPIRPDKLTLYVCGITPYDTTHLGHAFTYISFDALVRYLEFSGTKVDYTQNITDINDRDKDILKRAKEQNIAWNELAEFWTGKFLEDMTALNWRSPDRLIRASQSLNMMTGMVKDLTDRDRAYVKNGSVYLDIAKFPEYGQLSGLDKEQMTSTAREFEEDLDNPDKKHHLDITLWRAADPHQEKHIPVFDSPFGPGRPGWHIECSAMAAGTLGAQIDIHGGGRDLIYPHHEAEIVQAEGATGKKPFAGVWMHTGTVAFEGEKMSKSKGNLVMIADLLKNYSGNAIRWMLLSHHWRSDWEYTTGEMEAARSELEDVTGKLADSRDPKVKAEFKEIMENNLDTPGAIAYLKSHPERELFEALGFE